MRFLMALALSMAALSGAAEAAPKASASPVIVESFWVSKPSKKELELAYPAEASARGVGAGQVMLSCMVQKGGHLNCTVRSEKPEGLGFGAAAIKLSTLFQMAPSTGNGMATTGVHLNLPVTLTAPKARARI